MWIKGRPLSITCQDWYLIILSRVTVPWARIELGIFNYVEEDTEGLIRTEHLSSCWPYSLVLKDGTGATGGFWSSFRKCVDRALIVIVMSLLGSSQYSALTFDTNPYLYCDGKADVCLLALSTPTTH